MKNMIERPFAYCCAEAGGSVSGCDCVKKDHGTAWFSTPRTEAKATHPASNARQDEGTVV